MMKFLKNARGFSIPELLIAVGISGIVALAASQMMSDSYKNQNYIETLAEINKVAAVAQGILANKTNCNLLFNSTAASTNFSAPVQIGSIKVPTISGNQELIKVGNYGKYRIDQIYIIDSITNSRVKDIVLSFIWNQRPYLSTATIEKRISVFVEKDPGQDGVVGATDTWECGGVVRDSKLESQKALCDSLGTEFAAWGTPIANQCNIKEFKCPAGQVPFSLSSLGTVLCKPTQDALDLWALTNTAPVPCPAATTNIKIVFTSGQFRLDCGGTCSPTNRDWGAWSAWGTCTGGLQTRTKTCSGTVTCGGTDNCTGCSGGGCPNTTTETQTCSISIADGTACAQDVNVPGVPPCGSCTNAPTPSPTGYCCPANYSFGYRCGSSNRMEACYDLSTGATGPAPEYYNDSWDCDA